MFQIEEPLGSARNVFALKWGLDGQELSELPIRAAKWIEGGFNDDG
jgi:hypothetical protein